MFVYDRLWHTTQTIEALQANTLAGQSDLIIYSDAPKDEKSRQQVKEVRDYVHTIKGFKSITVVERQQNWGLARSIIEGVTAVIQEYGSVIVLEDDLVTSPYFLQFMNDALLFYHDKKSVWHICGWSYPFKPSDPDATFLWRLMNSWGWATWADRWQYFEKETQALLETFSASDIDRFNLDNTESFWNQVLDNHSGKLNTWAVFWYATIFQHQGLCLNPKQTYVANIGCDDSGTHCDTSHHIAKPSLNQNPHPRFETLLEEDVKTLHEIKQYYKSRKPTFFKRLIRKITRIITGVQR